MRLAETFRARLTSRVKDARRGHTASASAWRGGAPHRQEPLLRLSRPGDGSVTEPATPHEDRSRASSLRLTELLSSVRARQNLIAVPAALVVLALLGFLYHHLAATQPLNSDTSVLPIEARDFLSGNRSLRGWALAQDSFVLTELPMFILALAVRGYRPSVVVDVSAAFYTALVAAVVVTAAIASYRRSWRMSALIAFALVAVPGIPVGVSAIVSGPFHTGTVLFVLCGILAIHLSHHRFRVALSILAFVLLTLAVASDPLALYAGALPLLIVYGARAVSSFPHPDWDTVRGTLIALGAALAGSLFAKYSPRVGGFTIFTYPPTGYNFTALPSIPSNVGMAIDGWLSLFNANYLGQPVNMTSLNQLLHAVGYLFVLISVAYVIVRSVQAARRPEKESAGAGSPLVLWQILVGIIVCNVAAVIFSTAAADAFAMARYLVPATFAGAALAGAVGPALLPSLGWKLIAGSIAIVYIAFLPLALRVPAAPVPQQSLIQYLEANHLNHGLAEYWSAGVTTVASDGQVQVLPVSGETGRIGPIVALTNTSWFDRQHYANFLILDTLPVGGPDGGVDGNTAIRTFGEPVRVVHVGGDTILIWSHNILPDLGTGVI